jgi:hypothetical protein
VGAGVGAMLALPLVEDQDEFGVDLHAYSLFMHCECGSALIATVL